MCVASDCKLSRRRKKDSSIRYQIWCVCVVFFRFWLAYKTVAILFQLRLMIDMYCVPMAYSKWNLLNNCSSFRLYLYVYEIATKISNLRFFPMDLSRYFFFFNESAAIGCNLMRRIRHISFMKSKKRYETVFLLSCPINKDSTGKNSHFSTAHKNWHF